MMRILKFAKIRVYSLLTLFLFLFSGCIFYTTLPVDKSPTVIEQNIGNRQLFIIHTKGLTKQYILVNPTFKDDILSGTITKMPAGKVPPIHYKRFPKRKSKAYHPLKVIHIRTTLNDFTLGSASISLEEIKLLEVHELEVGSSVIATVALTGGVVVGGTAAFLAIACACPEVSSYNNLGETSHGSLFPGAMLNSLERDDYLILKNPELSNNELNLRIANVTTETQYINQLEILAVDHKGYDNLALTNEDKLAAYNNLKMPESAIENDLKEVSNLLSKKDGKNFKFDNSQAKKLNEVVLKFDKTALSKNPALVIHGQQSKWLDTVATVMLAQAGKYQEKWTEKNDDISPKKWKKNNQKRGLSLNVYLKKDNKWEYAGTCHDVGTGSERTLLMPLDLTNMNTDKVEIKLESAFKIWELDYVGLTDSWSTEIKTTPLTLNSATNQDGENVMTALAANDEEVVTQHEEGTFVEINVSTNNINESTIVLHGFGYYHKHSKFDNKVNIAFFAKFRQTMGLHDVSKALYQYMNTVQ